jgi:hypothetical protein
MSKIRFTDTYPDTLYHYFAKIPIHDFFIIDLYILVDESVIKNLNNYTKINFTYLDSVEGIYEVNVLVDEPAILENGFNFEGSQYDFQFKKFNNKLKFTAFYTTPWIKTSTNNTLLPAGSGRPRLAGCAACFFDRFFVILYCK